MISPTAPQCLLKTKIRQGYVHNLLHDHETSWHPHVPAKGLPDSAAVCLELNCVLTLSLDALDYLFIG